jgi:hypothetical protein
MVSGVRQSSFSGLFRFRKIAPTFHLFIRDGAFYFLLIFRKDGHILCYAILTIYLLRSRPTDKLHLRRWYLCWIEFSADNPYDSNMVGRCASHFCMYFKTLSSRPCTLLNILFSSLVD